MEEVCIDKQFIEDLLRIKEEFNSVIESLELTGDEEFMNSYKKAKEQVQKRDFSDWDAL
jgi:hypothetical protein